MLCIISLRASWSGFCYEKRSIGIVSLGITNLREHHSCVKTNDTVQGLYVMCSCYEVSMKSNNFTFVPQQMADVMRQVLECYVNSVVLL